MANIEVFFIQEKRMDEFEQKDVENKKARKSSREISTSEGANQNSILHPKN